MSELVKLNGYLARAAVSRRSFLGGALATGGAVSTTYGSTAELPEPPTPPTAADEAHWREIVGDYVKQWADRERDFHMHIHQGMAVAYRARGLHDYLMACCLKDQRFPVGTHVIFWSTRPPSRDHVANSGHPFLVDFDIPPSKRHKSTKRENRPDPERSPWSWV